MKRDHQTLSVVRENSPFATPPRVVVMADDDSAIEALQLAEALDEYGADAEVRLSGDVSDDDHHSLPDAVIFASTSGDSGVLRRGSVRVAVTDGSEPATGYDLVVSRPVNPSALMAQLGEYLPRHRM